ncbi:hypothetical protein JYU23_00130 [bacterium AH-315-C07]|nr:hypothetical protein [bacterium AH-315-C07]
MAKNKVSGIFHGSHIEVELDSDIAKYYFQRITGSREKNSHYEEKIDQAISKLKDDSINNQDMATLSREL